MTRTSLIRLSAPSSSFAYDFFISLIFFKGSSSVRFSSCKTYSFITSCTTGAKTNVSIKNIICRIRKIDDYFSFRFDFHTTPNSFIGKMIIKNVKTSMIRFFQQTLSYVNGGNKPLILIKITISYIAFLLNRPHFSHNYHLGFPRISPHLQVAAVN